MSAWWEDVIGTPWKLHGETPGLEGGLDCWTLPMVLFERRGLFPMLLRELWSDCDLGESREAVELYFERSTAEWESLGVDPVAATGILDLIVTESKSLLHASVIVEPAGLALTTSKKTGCIVIRARLLTNVKGVWRYRGAEKERS